MKTLLIYKKYILISYQSYKPQLNYFGSLYTYFILKRQWDLAKLSPNQYVSYLEAGEYPIKA
jgi:hypothetical protein